MNIEDFLAALPDRPAADALYRIAGPGGQKAMAMSLSAAAPSVDGRSARFRITSQDLDREGDVVITGGLDWSLFKSEPNVLLMHDGLIPVGTGRGPDGNVSLEVKDNEAFGTVYFHGEAADEAVSLIRKGILTGASIGFLPLKARPRVPGDPKKGYVIEKAAVFEWSLCATPVCPTCVRVEAERLTTLKKALAGCACGCDACKAKSATEPDVTGLDLAELFFPVDKFDLERANAKLCEVVKSATGPTPATITEAGVRYRLIDPAKIDPAIAAVEANREGVIYVYRKSLAAAVGQPKPDAQPAAPVTKAGDGGDWYEMHRWCKATVADVYEGMSEHAGHDNLTHTQRTAVNAYCGMMRKAMDGLDELGLHGPAEHMGRAVTKADPAPATVTPPDPRPATPAATPAELDALRTALDTFNATKARVLGA